VNGGADGAIRATESVRGEASGGGSVRITGSAKIHVRSSGGSTVDTE